MKMGVVADDVTGSNDIGIMFAKSGCLTHVFAYNGIEEFTLGAQSDAQIVILDTNSRLDTANVAYEKVFEATRALQEAGCRQFHNKTCSVFRGNIGTEFDAMLDALGLEFAVVVLGFPKNGRVTKNGIHYVHGKKLEDSEFRNDPVHPMRQSNLVDILQGQTKRKVGLVNYKVIDQGAAALREQIDHMRSSYNYVILDVRDQADLATIAAAVYDEPVLCGSSALAEELPHAWGIACRAEDKLDIPHVEGEGILCVAGSLMPQTAAQIEHLRQLGTPTFILDSLNLFVPAKQASEINRLVKEITATIKTGSDAMLHSPNDPEVVALTRATGAKHGLAEIAVSRLVSQTLAEVTARVLSLSGQNRLVVAGGETSADVCSRLGIHGMRVWKEIQPGLPSCVSLTKPPRLLVLKSGSFGKPDFFERALEHLRQQ